MTKTYIILQMMDNLNKISDPNDINNSIIFPIPESINNAVQGTEVRHILIEAKTRDFITNIIEGSLHDKGVYIESISQRIAKQWDN